MPKLLRINMTAGTCGFEALPEHYSGLGGRALASAIVAGETDPACAPLSAETKLVFAPGLLGATWAPSARRLAVGCKSPQDGSLAHGNAGGLAGGHLAALGIRALIIEGKTPEDAWQHLEISATHAALVPSTAAGLNNASALSLLARTYGPDSAVICIGRAGEWLLPSADIAFSAGAGKPPRHAGGLGAGAVMGSKGLKAIIIRLAIKPDDRQRHVPRNPEAFATAVRHFVRAMTAHPAWNGINADGNRSLITALHEAAGLFKNNPAPSPSSDGQAQTNGSLACMPGCPIRCGRVSIDTNGRQAGKKTEHGILAVFGKETGVTDQVCITRCLKICDDIGVDAFALGKALGIAVKSSILPYADGSALLHLMDEVCLGSPLGRALASGPQRAAIFFGLKSKGDALPGGADSQAATVPPVSFQERQIVAAFADSVGLCLFAAHAALPDPKALDHMAAMLNAALGLQISGGDLLSLGVATLQREQDFFDRARSAGAAQRQEKTKPTT